MFFSFFSGLFSIEEEVFQRAQDFYRMGQYQEALIDYHVLWERYPVDYRLMYNLGTCYVQLDDLGKGICFFLKANRLNGRDSDLLTNLSVARSRIVDVSFLERDFTGRMFSLFRFFSFKEILFVFLGGFFFLNVAVFLFIRGRRIFWRKQVLIGSLICFFLSGSLFCVRLVMDHVFLQGVIVEKKVSVFSGPSPLLAMLYYVHEGIDFFVEEQVDDWVKVRFPNGFTGWIEKKAIWFI